MRRPGTTYADSGTARLRTHASAVGVVSLPADAPVERQLVFLLGQVGELQQRVGQVENEVSDGLERRWTEAIEAESRRLHAEMETGLKRVRSEYLRIRLFGLVLLVGGGVLIALADFVA